MIFISLPLLLLLSSSIAYAAELTPPLPGAPTYIDISVEKAYELIEGNPEEIILLDVRREGEYNAEYIPGAITKISYSYSPYPFFGQNPTIGCRVTPMHPILGLRCGWYIKNSWIKGA